MLAHSCLDTLVAGPAPGRSRLRPPEETSTPSTDRELRALLRRIANGDREAMRRFHVLFHGRIARFLRPIATRADLVDEIVNDTLYSVWRSASRFRGDSLVSTWVLSIARRQGLKRSTREWRHDAHEATTAWVPEAHVEEPFELRDSLAHALAQLPDEQRVPVELAYVGGYSCEEIAAIMRCPTNTVKTRLFHARAKLRAALASNGEERLSSRVGETASVRAATAA